MAAKKRTTGEDRVFSTLKEISGKFDTTIAELRKTNSRLERVERYIPEMEVRLATAITALAGAIHEVRDGLRAAEADRHRLNECERRLAAVEKKTG